MKINSSRCGPFMAVVLVPAVVILGVLWSGCGGSDPPGSTSPTASASSGSTTSGVTATSAGSSAVPRAVTSAPTAIAETASTATAKTTTTLGPTTATAGATTTTAKTTTTARPTTTTARPTTTTAAATTTTKGEVLLRVTGPSGTRELSMADLKAMSSTEGWGGWKNQFGNITAPMLWRGVSVRALMDLAGGGGSVVVVASDGYEQAFSSDDLAGGVTMYHPKTGEEISSITGSLRTIIAYAEGGNAIGTGQGPLRIAFVSPEKEQVTDGTLWAKWVVKINVN